MKYTLIMLVFTLSLFPDKNWVKGKWNIDFIIKSGDTIYKHDNYYFTLEYNRSLNPNSDSNAVENMARQFFNNTSKLYWEFKDSTFQTAAMRSGGRGNLNDKDFGKYFCSNDTIYMINTTRNNYKSIFLKEHNSRYLYLKDNSDLNIYTKLKKVK